MVENESCYIFQLTYKVVEFIKGETEMNYEEKYKEALEWMRSIYPTMQGADKEDAEHHFPELCELEDERIRKAIICGMNALKEQHKETFASIPINDCIAWLEKQGEEKVYSVWVGGSEINDYYLTEKEAKKLAKEYKEDGYDDVIIEKQGEKKPIEKVEPKFKVGDVIRNKWSNRTKTIISIDDYQYIVDDGMPAQPFKVNINAQDNWELVEQKPAWSEEDERILNKIQDHLREFYVDKKGYPYVAEPDSPEMIEANWLKSLKPRWKPSEEQMEALKNRTHGLHTSSETRKILESLINDLEKL